MTRTKSTLIGLAVVFGTVLAGCSAAALPSVPLDPPPVTVTQSPSAAPTTVKATTPKPAAPAPVTVTAAPPPAPVTITEQQAPTVIVKQAPPAPVTVTQDKPYAEGRTVYTLPGGLLCADLNRMGFSSADAYNYWELHGNPPLMDKDLNGIPCETVYPGGAHRDYIDQ